MKNRKLNSTKLLFILFISPAWFGNLEGVSLYVYVIKPLYCYDRVVQRFLRRRKVPFNVAQGTLDVFEQILCWQLLGKHSNRIS